MKNIFWLCYSSIWWWQDQDVLPKEQDENVINQTKSVQGVNQVFLDEQEL